MGKVYTNIDQHRETWWKSTKIWKLIGFFFVLVIHTFWSWNAYMLYYRPTHVPGWFILFLSQSEVIINISISFVTVSLVWFLMKRNVAFWKVLLGSLVTLVIQYTVSIHVLN